MRKMVIAAALFVAGCSSFKYVRYNYSTGSFDGQVSTRNATFTLTHSTRQNAFITQIEPVAAIGGSMVQGWTFGAVQLSSVVGDAVHQEAAVAALAQIPGRSCRVIRTTRIENITVEHFYECVDGRPISRAELRAAGAAVTSATAAQIQ